MNSAADELAISSGGTLEEAGIRAGEPPAFQTRWLRRRDDFEILGLLLGILAVLLVLVLLVGVGPPV